MATIDSATTASWSDGTRCRNQCSAHVDLQRSKVMETDGYNGSSSTTNPAVSSLLSRCSQNADAHSISSTKLHVTRSSASPDDPASDPNHMDMDQEALSNRISEIQLDAAEASGQNRQKNDNEKDTTDDGSSSSSSSVCDISKNCQSTASSGIVVGCSIGPTSTSRIITTAVNTSAIRTNTISSVATKNFLPLYVPLSTLPKHIRNLPKTQSLDLADERTEDSLLMTESKSSDISASSDSKLMPKLQSLDQSTRPIYPNVPYSPYGSPYGSPRSGRRRPPLRESRRISIEQTGSFLQLNQYKLMDQIGQGSYGLVKLAYSEEDSTHYAMKILSKRKLLRKAGLMGRGPKKGLSPLDRVYREIAVLKKLDHPNVVKLVEVLDDPLEDSLYLVFELVQQGEVLNIPNDNPLSEERAWSVFRDALQGLEYLHYQRIIHGDIKPGNLLLGECGCVKIADLGVCNEFLGEDSSVNNGSTAGTPAFRAPETLLTGQHSYSGKAADIWALGATLYSLVFGNVPFIANNVPAVYEKIKHENLQFPARATKISDELKELLEKMLNKDPAKRLTLPQIKEHQWVTSNGTSPMKSEEENCRLVQITDEDINTVVKSIPKLDTLILIKTMLKKHSFLNPFSKGVSGRAPMRGGSRLERFTRAGRSNSAPGAYHMIERQLSSDNILPSVNESESSSCSSFDTNDGC